MSEEPQRQEPPADVPIGTRWAYRASYVPAEVPTIHCVVTIQRGAYGRFILTDDGWVRDDTPTPAVGGGE
jgi:hypothetical protein